MGKYEEALECFEDSSGGYERFLSMGEALAYLERYDEAFEKFDIAIEKIEDRFTPYGEPKDERDRENIRNGMSKTKEIKTKSFQEHIIKLAGHTTLKGITTRQ